jgi:flagellar basal body L-ring protein FlgH
MRSLAVLAALLGMAGSAWAQSLLGESGASPYDPTRRPVYKKHDFLKVLVNRPEPARAASSARPARRAPARAVEALADASFAVTVEVVDIRPNGTLVVQALKRRRVGGEEEVIKVTGEVVAASVADGAVHLEDVNNLSVVYEGPGKSAGLGALGFLNGLLGRVWPF